MLLSFVCVDVSPVMVKWLEISCIHDIHVPLLSVRALVSFALHRALLWRHFADQ
jgi:hypothetical protein